MRDITRAVKVHALQDLYERGLLSEEDLKNHFGFTMSKKEYKQNTDGVWGLENGFVLPDGYYINDAGFILPNGKEKEIELFCTCGTTKAIPNAALRMHSDWCDLITGDRDE